VTAYVKLATRVKMTKEALVAAGLPELIAERNHLQTELLLVTDERDRALIAVEECHAQLVARNGLAREMADLRDEHDRTVAALAKARQDANHHSAEADRLTYALEEIRGTEQHRGSRMHEIARRALDRVPIGDGS